MKKAPPISFKILIVLFGILALAFLAPLGNNTTLIGEADYINHIASIIQAKMALLEGQFPLRVAPLELHGWRYPLFQFYSPTAYLFTAEIYRYLTPHNPIMAYKIIVWLALVIGGLSMYRLCYWFTQHSTASLIASVAYLASPYYIIVLTRMDDLGESIALGLLPAVIYVTLQLFYQPQKCFYLVASALGWFLILTIHLISFVYSSCAVGLLLLLLTLQDLKHWQRLVYAACAYVLGVMMGWWYLGPVAYFRDAIAIKSSFAMIETLHPTLAELFFPSALLRNPVLSQKGYLYPGFGWPILFALSYIFYAYWLGHKPTCQRTQTIAPILLFIFLLFGFFIWSPFNIWSYMPDTLRIGQYTWRLLNQSIWIGALLIAYAIALMMRMELNLKEIVVSIFLIIACAYPWFPPHTPSTMTLLQLEKHPLMTFANDAYTLDFSRNTPRALRLGKR